MSRYIFSPLAQMDIEDIWDYTGEHWNIDQAELYIRDIKVAVEALAGDPRRGRACDEIRTGYYKYAAGSHVVFYRLIDTGIEVIRILHQRRDFGRHL